MKIFVTALFIALALFLNSQLLAANGECVPKEGSEAHESFCNGHNKQICKVHSGLCIWE